MLVIGLVPVPAASHSSCTGGALNVVAHEDDDLFFQSPDVLHDVQAGRCVMTVFLTAGDSGYGPGRWVRREAGPRAAYAQMAGVSNSWITSHVTVDGSPILVQRLAGAPNIRLAFLRLPDGSLWGRGYRRYGHQSLEELWNGAISSITSVDDSITFTRASLTTTLTRLMERVGPVTIRTLDFTGSFGDGDHPDHHAVALFTQAAGRDYSAAHTLLSYQGYGAVHRRANVTGDDLAGKRAAFAAYAADDAKVHLAGALGRTERARLRRQYVVASEPTGNPAREPGVSVTASSQDRGAGQEAARAVDGYALGYPLDPTAEWASRGQGAGAWVQVTFTSPQTVDGVVLYDRPNLDDQITAARLVFSDGDVVAVGALANNGSGVTVPFSARTTTSIRLEVTAVSDTTSSIGLAEFQVCATLPAQSEATATGSRTSP